MFDYYCCITKFPTKLTILKPRFTFAHVFLEFGKEFGKCSDLYCLGVSSGCSPVSAGADIIWGHNWDGDPGWFMNKPGSWVELGDQRPAHDSLCRTESQQGRLALKHSILSTYWPGQFLIQYPIILPFHTLHVDFKARILKWIALPFPSGPHSVRHLPHVSPNLVGPTGPG